MDILSSCCGAPMFRQISGWQHSAVLVGAAQRTPIDGMQNQIATSLAGQDTCSVAIPEDGLNLTPYCTPGAVKQVSSPLYDLFAVVCHYGSLEVRPRLAVKLSWPSSCDTNLQHALHSI